MLFVFELIKGIIDISDWIPKVRRFKKKHPIAISTFLPVLVSLILILINHLFANITIQYIKKTEYTDCFILFMFLVFVAFKSWRIQRSEPSMHSLKKVNLFKEAFKMKDIGDMVIIQSTLWCLTENEVGFFEAIEKVINKGYSVEILISLPNSEAIKKLESKRTDKDSSQNVEHRAFYSLGRLCSKINKKGWEDSVHIKTYNVKDINKLPFIKAVMISQNSIYLKRADYEKENDNNILDLLLNKNRLDDHNLYFEFAFRYFKRLEERSRELPSKIKTEALKVYRES